MTNYDKTLIFNYITGNDILNYDISYLKNDINFMKAVFNYSDNFDLYDVCSDGLKKDFNFTKFLIKKFKSNLDFVEKVSLTFQSFMENNVSNIELYILMNEIFSGTNTKEERKYKLYLDSIFDLHMNRLKALEEIYINDIEMLSIVKNKFSFIEEEYKESTIIKNFFANRMLENNLSLNLDDPNNVLKKFCYSENLYKSIINYISHFDPSLATYLLSNTNLLEQYKNALDNRNYSEKENRKLDTLNKIDIYLDVYKDEIKTDKKRILYYFSKRLGIDNLLCSHNIISPLEKEFFDSIDLQHLLFDDKIVYLKDFYHVRNISETILHDKVKKFTKNNNFDKNIIIPFRKV